MMQDYSVKANKQNYNEFNFESKKCLLIITFITCILAYFSLYTIIIVFFGILPSLVAIVIDQDNSKYISKIVLTYNILGIAPFVLKILHHTTSNILAIDIIVDPFTWLVIYGAASIGWLIYWSFPPIAILFNNIRVDNRIAQLQSEINELSKEWGDKIKLTEKY